MPIAPPPAADEDSNEGWRDVLARLGTRRVYPPQTIVIQEGDTSDLLYLIHEGTGRIYSSNDEGRVIVYGQYAAGDLLGEPALDGGTRSASVMTIEKTVCTAIRLIDFKQRIVSNPDFAMQVIFNLIRVVRASSENIKSLALDDVYGRVIRLLMKSAIPEGDHWIIPHKLTHQEIADHVGSSREMVGRILKELHTGGYVLSDKNTVVIRKKPPAGW